MSLATYLDSLTIAEPTAIMVNAFGIGEMKDMDIVGLARKHFDLTPKGIVETLDLRRPIFRKTAEYGHFGRNDPDFTWERTDVAEDIAKSAALFANFVVQWCYSKHMLSFFLKGMKIICKNLSCLYAEAI